MLARVLVSPVVCVFFGALGAHLPLGLRVRARENLGPFDGCAAMNERFYSKKDVHLRVMAIGIGSCAAPLRSAVFVLGPGCGKSASSLGARGPPFDLPFQIPHNRSPRSRRSRTTLMLHRAQPQRARLGGGGGRGRSRA